MASRRAHGEAAGEATAKLAQNGSNDVQNGHHTPSSDKNDAGSSSSAINLKKEIGLFSGVAIISGIIIGSGIFVSPKGVIMHTGSPGMALLVWIISGCLSTVGALCYAELGTMIPRSGGDYEYIRESLGNLPAFLYLWSAIVTIMPAGNAVIALTFANYILQPWYPDCEAPTDDARLIAALCLTILTYLNCVTVKWVTRIQGFFSVTKILALIAIILCGFYHVFIRGHTENLQNPFRDSKFEISAIALSFYSGLFSYSGWNYLNFLTEEVKNPYRNLPRAIYISLPMVTIIYVLVNMAYFAVLTPQEIGLSNAVAVTFSLRTSSVLAFLMPILVACSCFGAVNGTLLSSSRLFFIGARYRHLPDLLALVNVSNFTPVPAILCIGGLSLLMLSIENVYDLLNYAAYVEALSQGVCIAALLYLRYTRPDLERPIRVNIGLPIGFLAVLVVLLVLPIYEAPGVFGIALLIVFLGVPVYFAMLWFRRASAENASRRFMGSATRFVQKLTNSVKEEIAAEEAPLTGSD